MAELADAIDLGSIINRCAGSSPVIRTKKDTLHHRRMKRVFFVAKRFTLKFAPYRNCDTPYNR